MNDEKQIMNIFAQAYQLLAKASKQLPSKEGFLLILEMLGEDGIQECAKVADLGPEAVALAMIQIIQLKQAQKAANGAKLLYIMQLRGICPDGYLKKGGKCKPCEKAAGVFNNKADLFNKGGGIDWKSEYERLKKPKLKTAQEDDNKKLPRIDLPRRNLPTRYNKQPYDDIRKLDKNDLPNKTIKASEGVNTNDFRAQQLKIRAKEAELRRNNQEGVYFSDGKLRGTEQYPIPLKEITATAPVRYPLVYNSLYLGNGRTLEWITPYGASIQDPSLFEVFRISGPGNQRTYYKYDSPEAPTGFRPVSNRKNEKYDKRFDKAYKRTTPNSRKKASK